MNDIERLPEGLAPESTQEFVLASRTGRLVARWIDTLLFVPIATVGFAALFAFGGFAGAIALRLPKAFGSLVASFGGGILALLIGLAMLVAGLALLAYQYWLISTRGQTIGKRIVGIKIVHMDGSPVGFVDGVIVREWLLWIGAFVLWFYGWIPYLGQVLLWLDIAPALGSSRRCIHDYLAGTQVVRARFNKGKVAVLLGISAAIIAGLGLTRPDLFLPPDPSAPTELPAPSSPRSRQLIDQLGDPDAPTRWKAAQALGELAKTSQDAADVEACVAGLVGALKDEHAMVRQDAATALGRIGPRAKSAAPALARASTDDPATAVQTAAQSALKQVSP